MGNYTQKLANMRSRRLGFFDSTNGLSKSASFIEAAALTEAYETRAKTEAIKYALGAMQALESKYTQISFQEGERVRNQLNTGLQNAGIPATFEYQGSVPLNVHIRFDSDIDLLVIHDKFITFDGTGPKASAYNTIQVSVLGEMLTLRSKCEQILEQKFPAVTVDKSGAKSISLSGGSLQRKVDVVPSYWHDTATYQITKAKHDREVKILNKDEYSLISNRPFLHMLRIEEKDFATNYGAKKAIRLLKNIRKDAIKDIKLSSYDIAALVWNFTNDALSKPYYLELSLVAETQRHLQFFVDNLEFTKTLDVPDLSRKIIDSPEKVLALQLLKMEVDQLAEDIARELKPLIYNSGYEAVQKSLMEAQVF